MCLFGALRCAQNLKFLIIFLIQCLINSDFDFLIFMYIYNIMSSKCIYAIYILPFLRRVVTLVKSYEKIAFIRLPFS